MGKADTVTKAYMRKNEVFVLDYGSKEQGTSELGSRLSDSLY